MAKQIVNIGSAPDDGTGDPLRQAMDKINDNFNEVYRAVGGLGSNSLLNMVNYDGSDQTLQILNKYNAVSFYLDTEADLYALSAGTYHGCIAHVHATGGLYYAHGKWNKLLTDNANNDVSNYADSLSDIAYDGLLVSANNSGFGLLNLDGISDGSSGQVLATDGAGTFTFVNQTGGGGGAAANTFGTVVVAGQANVVSDSTTDVLTLVAGTNMTITTDQANDTITFNATGGSGGGFTPSRVTQAVTSSSILNGATDNIEFNNLGVSYALYGIQTDKAAMVRVYNSDASRTADAGRVQGADPVEGTGVITEFITSAANTFILTPAVYGWVATGANTIPVSVKNNSGSTGTVTVTLIGLKLEDA